MKYIIVADTHLGVTDDTRLAKLTGLLTTTKCPIIWLGDAIDTLAIDNSYTYYKYLMKPEDIWISGNHDFGQSTIRTFSVGNTFLTHGDMVDFGYLIGRLQQIRNSQLTSSKATRLEVVLSKLRRWGLNDTYMWYELMYQLSDGDIRAFNTSKITVLSVLAYFKILIKMLQLPVSKPSIIEELPYPKGEKMLGYATHNPEILLKLILIFHPEAKLFDNIVVGHTHHAIDTNVTVDGKTYRFITLGAWVGDVDATYLQIKEDNSIEVINI